MLLWGKRIGIGKLSEPFREETLDLGHNHSKCLLVRDRDSVLIYLIEIGSGTSLLPADPHDKNSKPSDLILFTANDSRVSTFGKKRITLDLELRNKFYFCVASVRYPIIKADLLAHFRLVPFLHESRLVDTITGLSMNGFLKFTPTFGLSLIDRPGTFTKIFAESPELIYTSEKTNTTSNNRV